MRKKEETPLPRGRGIVVLQSAGERAPAPREDDGPLETGTVLSLFGGTTRAGVWAPADRTVALAGYANIKLDLRRSSSKGEARRTGSRNRKSSTCDRYSFQGRIKAFAWLTS